MPSNSSVRFRLNVVIALQCCILVVLLWPMLPQLLLYLVVGAFLVSLGALVWGLSRGT